MDHPSDPDPTFLQKRLQAISRGMKEGIRREVKRLRERGLPIYVAHNGKVVDLQLGGRPQGKGGKD